MIGHTIAEVGHAIDISTAWKVGTYIHRAREQLLEESAEIGYHYMLWLDSDHTFPKDALIRLLAHDVEMVGINYSTRGVPPRYVAVERTANEHQEDGLGGKLLETTEESTGLQDCEAIGFGMVLMKMAIYPTLPKDGTPNFFYHADLDDPRFDMGEDIWFCKRVREAGWKIRVDAELSRACQHIGQMNYRLDHVWTMKEGDDYVDYDVRPTADSDSELGEPVGSGQQDT